MWADDAGFAIAFWVCGLLFGIAAAYLAERKGYNRVIWFLAGFVLSIFAPLILACMPSKLDSRQCPHCAEKIRPAARVCRHCGRDVQPSEVGGAPEKVLGSMHEARTGSPRSTTK